MEKREENFSGTKLSGTTGQAPDDNIYGSEFPMTTGRKLVRYSLEELKEFKVIVTNRLAEARSDYELLSGTLNRREENDDKNLFSKSEDGSDGFSNEEIVQLTLRQKKLIENLENALVRIDNGTYGICRISGKLIAKERLSSVPHTTVCIDAKFEMSRLN